MHTDIALMHDADKLECDYYNAAKKIEIRLETRHHAILELKIVVEHATKDALVSDVSSRVVETMVTELIVHAAANVVELFVKTLVDLKITPLLTSGLVRKL